jgi:ADP-ribosylglycohydrolase
MRVAALAWEHERTTADALARQVAEAERFLHASTGQRVASS